MKNLLSLHFFASYVAAQQLMDRMCHFVQCSWQEACFLEVGVDPGESGDWELESKGQGPGCFVRVNYHDLTGTQNARETDVSLDYLG